MKCLLLLALIALFFKAYAVEADIRLREFYLHLPDRLYALKRGHGLLFRLGSPFYIQFFIEPGVESPSLHIHCWSCCWSSEPS